MSLQDIEQAVTTLPPEQFKAFAAWFDELRMDRWDKQIEADDAAGRLDHLLAEAEADIAAGRTRLV